MGSSAFGGRGDQVREYFRQKGTVSKWWDPERDALKHFFLHEIRIFDSLVKNLPKDITVLDVCTGRGRFAIRLAELGFKHVEGVDISKEMLSLAFKTCAERGVSVNFKFDEAEKLQTIEDGTVSVICLMDAFDHIPDTRATLRTILTKLRSDGMLIGTFVNSNSLYGLLFSMYQRLFGHSKMIAQVFSPGEFRQHLKNSGFTLDQLIGIEIFNLPHSRIPIFRWLLLPFRILGRIEGMLFNGYKTPLLAHLSVMIIFVAKRNNPSK